MKVYHAYTDGSHRNGVAGFGFVIVDPETDTVVYEGSGLASSEAAKEIWNIAGELKAAMAAIFWARSHNSALLIHHDYEGVGHWVKGTWKAKSQYTRQYRDWMKANGQYIAGFTWVKGHAGNKYNERADGLAYDALNKAA